MGFKENLAELKSIDTLECIEIYNHEGKIGTIPNEEGKRGSLQVYANILGFQNGNITQEMAERGLEIFGEYVADETKNPGKHPNIAHLLNVTKKGERLDAIIKYK